MLSAEEQKLAFEEYKLVVESTDKLSARRAAATQLFFSIDAAILGAITFVALQQQAGRWEKLVLTSSLSFFGLLLSVLWYRTTASYRRLIGWRYDRIMEMEASLPSFYRLYRQEWQFLFSGKARPERTRFWFGASGVELALPWCFFVFHLVIGGLLGIRLAPP
jgi:hypothetical protein